MENKKILSTNYELLPAGLGIPGVACTTTPLIIFIMSSSFRSSILYWIFGTGMWNMVSQFFATIFEKMEISVDLACRALCQLVLWKLNTAEDNG